MMMVMMVMVCTIGHMWGSEDNFWELMLKQGFSCSFLSVVYSIWLVSVLSTHIPIAIYQCRSVGIMDINNHIWFLWVPEIRLRFVRLVWQALLSLSHLSALSWIFIFKYVHVSIII